MASTHEPRPERVLTDSRLGAERHKADAELARRRAAIDADADRVLYLARQRADAVVAEARRRADERTDESGGSRSSIHGTRIGEDGLLAEERATADAELSGERGGRARSLAAILRSEREATDASLMFERGRADDAIAARDAFLGLVSHDLHNLLAAVSYSVSSLMRRAAGDDRETWVFKNAEVIDRATVRMGRLIGDLVDVVSIEAGKLAMVPDLADARRLVKEICELFGPTASAQGVSLRCDAAGEPLFAMFDYSRLLQVLTNLVGNALKFTPEGGAVAVNAEQTESEIRFSVADTGRGIPAEHVDSIFERFSQAPSAKRKGLGLGLHIASSIVQAHGGRIWVASTSGAGTTLCFTIPNANLAPSG
jgi:signal transduction histidine kinase